MPQHIGIVGCSAEGASLCYRTICVEGGALLGHHAHPEVSMHTPSLADYETCLGQGDLDGIAALMLSSARKLAAAGADFLICPDNTIHQAMHLVDGFRRGAKLRPPVDHVDLGRKLGQGEGPVDGGEAGKDGGDGGAVLGRWRMWRRRRRRRRRPSG